ncbi:MAG TPA: hypothetical protein DEQ28_01960 [Clostridiales bacterium]|nr:hypothetical protein [Clostridiales bacterium]
MQVLVGLAVFLAAFSLGAVFFPGLSRIPSKLELALGAAPAPSRTLRRPILRGGERLSYFARLEREAAQAGLVLNARQTALLSASVAGVVLLSLQGMLGSFVLSLAAALAVFAVVPRLLLNSQKQRRLEAFTRQLDKALDLMADAMRSGASLMQAVGAAGLQMPAPLGEEFRRAYHAMELGTGQAKALELVQERLPACREFDMLVLAVRVNVETGGALTHCLEGVAEAVRERRMTRQRLLARTAEGRFSAGVLTALPVVAAALLTAVSPGYLDPFTATAGGRVVLLLCAVSVGVGWLVIRKLVSVDV